MRTLNSWLTIGIQCWMGILSAKFTHLLYCEKTMVLWKKIEFTILFFGRGYSLSDSLWVGMQETRGRWWVRGEIWQTLTLRDFFRCGVVELHPLVTLLVIVDLHWGITDCLFLASSFGAWGPSVSALLHFLSGLRVSSFNLFEDNSMSVPVELISHLRLLSCLMFESFSILYVC